jgi:2-keto-4-pentenoate hydratase/2-oxohepta-3-ene-1,7-dioic acid hydratase in catechol pathway
LIADGEEIQMPRSGGRVEYEGELAVVIGKKARYIESHRVAAYIMGYTCFNDVSEREAQHEDNLVPYRAKGHDTFGPMGPVISTVVDPDNLLLETRLNGEVRQQTNTKDLIYKVPDLISFISGIMTLLPGDVIATGTPAGSGPMQPGDIVEVFIENIGTLKNKVVTSP